MERTYTDTPEPRYVEKAKESETTSALPNPTITDAGKVLGVDEQGKYALTEGGGGGGDTPYITGEYSNTQKPYQIQQRMVKIGDYTESPVYRPGAGKNNSLITSIDKYDQPTAIPNIVIHLPNGTIGGVTTDPIWIGAFIAGFDELYIGIYNGEYVLGTEGSE